MAQYVVFSRCPVGSAIEYLMRTGLLENMISRHGMEFRLLQQMDETVHKAHFTQEEPLHFRDGGNIPPIWAQSQGDRTILLGVTYQHEIRGLFVRDDSKITNISELAGKRIAVPVRENMPVDFQRYTALCGIESIVAAAGLTMNDVSLVPVRCEAGKTQKSDQLTVMKRDFDFMTNDFVAVYDGFADAVYGNSVKAVRHIQAGELRNLLMEENLYDSYALNNNNPLLITCSRQFALKHPAIVVDYLALLLGAAEFAAKHRREFISVVAPGTYEASIPEFTKAFAPDCCDIRKPKLGAAEIVAVQKRAEFLFRVGGISSVPDIERWADIHYLREAERQYADHGSVGNNPYFGYCD